MGKDSWETMCSDFKPQVVNLQDHVQVSSALPVVLSRAILVLDNGRLFTAPNSHFPCHSLSNETHSSPFEFKLDIESPSERLHMVSALKLGCGHMTQSRPIG